MTRFEFNSVLVSIVLAFALSEVLTAWGRIIRHRQQIDVPWPFGLLSLWVTLSIVLHWFGLWFYRDVPFDRALQTLVALSPSLAIALVCHVLTPDLTGSHQDELETHYRIISRWALLLSALFMLLATGSDLVLPDVRETGPPAYFIASAASFTLIAFLNDQRLHVAVLGLNAAAACAVLLIGGPPGS